MAIRITDKLYSSTVAGIVADSFSISGGYITVQTLEERDNLNVEALIKGQPLYITNEGKSYRWGGSSWEEDTLDEEAYSHIYNKSNPHEVTKDQLDLDQVDNTSDMDKPISNATQTALNNMESQTVKRVGDQEIKGSLTLTKEEGEDNFTGNLVVQGNLVVSGATIVENHETLQVADNILILNSNGNSLGSALSGTVIKTATDTAYGIVYNAVDDSVSLGKGIIDDKENFIFNEGEGNPIAIRDQADSFSNGNLIVWDSAKNRLVDGGAVPTLETLGGASQDDILNINSVLESHAKSITNLNSKGESIENSILTINNNIGDLTSLPTSDKTVKGSIAEVYNKLGVDVTRVSDNLTSHQNNKTNPHEVTIDQLINRNTAFNSNFETSHNNIKMNGVASVGTLNTIARADHIHPVDTSRAPAIHTEVEANSITLGHVKVDSAMDDNSFNPVQNKVIKSYIEDQISGLTSVYNPIIENYSNIGDSSKTITSVTQSNGKVEVIYNDINIKQSQVENLINDLGNINTSITDEISARSTKDTELETAIADEASVRAAQDAAILSQMQGSLANSITELTSNYNLNILKNLPADTTKKYLLFYNDNEEWDWLPLKIEQWIFESEDGASTSKNICLLE